MTTWKDGGWYGLLCREITNEAGNRTICKVWTKQQPRRFSDVKPWPEGEANFRLILQAPEMLEALEAIAASGPPRPDQITEVYHQCKRVARAAIAAVKGENGDDIG